MREMPLCTSRWGSCAQKLDTGGDCSGAGSRTRDRFPVRFLATAPFRSGRDFKTGGPKGSFWGGSYFGKTGDRRGDAALLNEPNSGGSGFGLRGLGRRREFGQGGGFGSRSFSGFLGFGRATFGLETLQLG